MSKHKTLPDCDQEIFDKGTMVFMTHSMPATSVEAFIKRVREDSGQRVDWHYIAGRARVFALGDPDEVRKSLWKFRDFHDAALGMTRNPHLSHFDVEKYCQGIWAFSGFPREITYEGDQAFFGNDEKEQLKSANAEQLKDIVENCEQQLDLASRDLEEHMKSTGNSMGIRSNSNVREEWALLPCANETHFAIVPKEQYRYQDIRPLPEWVEYLPGMKLVGTDTDGVKGEPFEITRVLVNTREQEYIVSYDGNFASLNPEYFEIVEEYE